MSDAGLEVFNTPELLTMILLFGDWHTVMTLARTSRYARQVAQGVARANIRSLLLPFVDEGDFPDFIRMLDTTGSGVIGSVARRLFYMNSNFHHQASEDGETKYLCSGDLNIVVPSGNLQEVKNWFLAKGVKEFRREATQLPYTSVVRAVYHGSRPAKGAVPVRSAYNTTSIVF